MFEPKENEWVADYLIRVFSLFSEARNGEEGWNEVRQFVKDLVGALKSVAPIGHAISEACPGSQVILAAAMHIITVCQRVTEEYDLVESVFKVVGEFTKRLSILEEGLPKNEEYHYQVVGVFRSILIRILRQDRAIHQHRIETETQAR